MLMVDKKKFEWFKELGENTDFMNTLSLSDNQHSVQYNHELVLKFISLFHFQYEPRYDVSAFLDECLESILTDQKFDLTGTKEIFETTFKKINEALGNEAFKKHSNGSFTGRFLESAFEAIAIGVACNNRSYSNGELKDKVIQLWSEEKFTDQIGSGSNAKARIPRITTFAKDYFKS